jgi:hypothetical protein
MPLSFGFGQWYRHDDYVLLGGFRRNVDPALVLMAGDLNGDQAGGRVASYAAGASRDHKGLHVVQPVRQLGGDDPGIGGCYRRHHLGDLATASGWVR